MAETWDEQVGRMRAMIRGDHGDLSERDAAAVQAALDRALASPPSADGRGLRGALQGALDYLWPSADEGHTGFVDRLGMQFYRETGVWPHFKSAPLEMEAARSDEEQLAVQKRWSAWLTEKRDAAAAAAVRALSAPPASADGLRERLADLVKRMAVNLGCAGVSPEKGSNDPLAAWLADAEAVLGGSPFAAAMQAVCEENRAALSPETDR